MSTNRLTDVAAKTHFGYQLGRFEPAHVLWVVEEMPQHCAALAYSNRKASENHL